jgi:hypothetical protein
MVVAYDRISSSGIELDTSIPPVHKAKYRLNPNYAIVVIDKLLTVGFIQLV